MRTTGSAIFISGLLAATAVILLVVLAPRARRPAGPPAVTPPPVVEVPRPPSEPLKTYVNARTGFSVRYPETIQPTEDVSDMQLSGYIPVCDPDHAVVCFPYPKETYEGTNFESAAFAVHVRKDLKTQDACGRAQNGETPDGEANINGVTYKKFAFGDAATSHRLDGENYRAFKDGACFELSTRVATTVFEVYEPGMIARFSDADRAALQSALDAMLMSFRFTVGS